MRIKSIHIATGVMMGLLLTGAAVAADQPVSEAPMRMETRPNCRMA